MQILHQEHVDRTTFEALNVAVIGYGSQGRAQARNLRDSGVDVTVGLRPNGRSNERAVEDGFNPVEPAAAVRDADVIALLIPDMQQASVYRETVEPNLREGALMMFAHGFAVHYGQIETPANCDVALVAPKSPGALVRRTFEQQNGVPCLLAVAQDATGTAEARALAYAHGIGGTRAGVIRTNFAEETETDLFGEQAVLCGGTTELITAGYETLVEAGYQPEVAYFECLHELKLIVDLLHEGGLARMHQFVSETAKYGGLTRGSQIVDGKTKSRMREVLQQIQDGQFAREWIAEDGSGGSRYRSLLNQNLAHPIEAVGQRLRATMSWLPHSPGKTSEGSESAHERPTESGAAQ